MRIRVKRELQRIDGIYSTTNNELITNITPEKIE